MSKKLVLWNLSSNYQNCIIIWIFISCYTPALCCCFLKKKVRSHARVPTLSATAFSGMCVCLKNYYLQSIFHVSYCRSDTTSADLWANLAEQPIWTLPLMNTSAKEMQDAEFRNIPQARVSPTVSKTSQPSFPCQSEVFVHCPSSAWLIWDTLGCNENKLHIWSEPLTTVLHSLVIFLP